MSMGYSAAYADVVEDKDVKTLCPIEYNEFMECVKEDACTFDEAAIAASHCCMEDDYPEVNEKYVALVDAFKKATGLDLYLGFHNSDDNGDCYDEVSGPYWCVDGMYELTPAGKKWKQLIQRKTFVQLG